MFVSIRNGFNVSRELEISIVRLLRNQYLWGSSWNIFLLESTLSKEGRLGGEILFGLVKGKVQMVERYIVLSFCRKG